MSEITHEIIEEAARGVHALAALRLAAQEAGHLIVDKRPPKSLCLECGPNVPVDEDGCCGTCGRDAVGPWLEKVRVEP